MSRDIIFYSYSLSLILSIGLVIISWKWNTLARTILSLLFLWAGFYNLRTSFIRPDEYLQFANFSYSHLYRTFILGFFSKHITLIVASIAFLQITMAIMIALKGKVVLLGLAGMVIFLVAITPLGIGSAFPSSLLMAIACILLMREDYSENLSVLIFRFFKDKL